MLKPIINIADVSLDPTPPKSAPTGPAAERFEAKTGVIVLHGSGEVRIGEARYPIRTGDIIACPAGGRETAHQIINTGSEELRYLAVSTEHSLEMAQYPDSGKFAVKAEFGIALDGTPQRFVFVGRETQSVDYWDGE